ncbi:MAG: thioredoxin domain-containing protein [Egibacteraceae bacterium]
MPNRLQYASSPYLRQHAENPVDWFEWGSEAFQLARATDRPLFLSVGYSSCHWCHVMAHESFEDDEVAKLLNERFVSIKVDREERPDIDSVYMSAVQILSGGGGWPMSVFLTPDGVPFFGGTYWPRQPRAGMPGFVKVLDAVWQAWTQRRDHVLDTGRRLTDHLRRSQDLGDPGAADAQAAGRAAEACVRQWDDRLGGFGAAPKFPQAMTIDFLLAHALRTGDGGALRAATHSLEAMSRGGIADHVGGGFHRYSVDAHWLVPHFEKMLYDNALLLRAYTHAHQVTGERRFRQVAVGTADYLLRELRHPGGAFFSATDADSEGIEGKFFVWTAEEFDEVVTGAGEDPAVWRRFFGVRQDGNWHDPHGHAPAGTNILHQPGGPPPDPLHLGGPPPDPLQRGGQDEADEAFASRRDRVRAALYARRSTRVPPGLDDKVLTSWNALALGALAEAGAALDVPAYVEAARDCARFLRDQLVVGGQLRHTWKQGHGAAVPAFCEDVAYLAQALLVLYEAGGEVTWLRWARELAADAQARFADGQGAYYTTAHDAEALLTRPRDLWDNATPGAASVMADVHLRLYALTGEPEHDQLAERTIGQFIGRAEQVPTGYGELLRSLERLLAGPREVAIVGAMDEPMTAALVTAYREQWRPGAVLAVGPPGTADVPLLAGRDLVDGQPAAYVCQRFACARPVTGPAALRALLD